MSVAQADKIDIVALDPKSDRVLLIMVEDRPWGDKGELLQNLQDKFNTYLAFVTEGQLLQEYPDMKGKKVEIQLRSSQEPGERELKFLNLVEENFLKPEDISFSWKLIETRLHGQASN